MSRNRGSSMQFEVDATKALLRLGRLPDQVFEASRHGFQEFGAVFERDMIKDRMRNDWKTHSREGVGTRTGTLRRSLFHHIAGKSLGALRCVIRIGGGAARKYAAMQEYGNERAIRPVRAKYLKIPLPDALTRAGIVKKAATGPLDLLFGKKRGGKQTLFLGRKAKSKRGKNKYFFVLKDEIPAGAIPPRLGFYDEWEDYKRTQSKRLVAKIARRLKTLFRRG